ncbi:MAG TPA: extracellular solute-binding protein [Flexivirga sp.]|uniref:ABC transporter substrate-binding protein n=1 Tax=Flexivirga sp. TaxID=1962927 RepID=UPI002B5E2936|nr:extracellular solute-binding protein [Flexivirga sp.]HWC21841.1 extracellular solute-binding protein [Flexivirga sp.]
MKRRDFLKLSGVGGAAALSTGALTGCSRRGWGLPAADGGRVELTYALWDATQQIGYQKSIDAFMKLHPHIHVTIQQVSYTNYQQKITQQYISGNAPDVFWVNTPWIGDWVVGGVMADISDRLAAEKLDMSIYNQSLLKLHQYRGRTFGLPKDWDTAAFFTNRAHLAKCGFRTAPTDLSWNPKDGGSYLHFLKQLTVDTKGRNALDPKFDPGSVDVYATAAPNDFQTTYGNFFAMNGGSLLPHPYATRSVIDTPQNLETLTFLTRMLRAAHVIVPCNQTGPNGDSTNTQTLFSSGRMAMWLTGDWTAASVSKLSGIKIGSMPMPTGPRGRISVLNGLCDGIAANTAHPDESWALVKWLGGARSQEIMGSGGYVWPAITALDPHFERYWLRKGLDMSPFLEESHGRTVNFPVSSGMQDALNDLTVALGPTFLGTQSPAEGLRAAQRIFDYRISYNTPEK